MWPPGGKSEEDARTANAEMAHAGDYAAACRRIAQLEIALQDVKDQHADLIHAYDLAKGTAEVLTSKTLAVAHVEQIVQLNREFGTDAATEAFVAGGVHLQRKAAEGRHAEDKQIKDDIMAWLAQHRASYVKAGECDTAIMKYTTIGLTKAAEYRREWEEKNGFKKPPKEPKKRASKVR